MDEHLRGLSFDSESKGRWRRGEVADGTPCSGRKAAWIAPNGGSPRAWASEALLRWHEVSADVPSEELEVLRVE